ncbi:MAG: hypothetical protein HC822_28385 [Oscillochloris sp.]|nr:hypothetical protein [Oscillochloris sp.]
MAAAVLQIPAIPDDDLLAVLTALGAVPDWLTPRIAAAESLRLAAALAAATGDLNTLHQLASVRAQAATANQQSVAELLVLLEDEDPAVRVIAAADPRTPPEALAAAKQREDWTEVDLRVYEALAGNPSSPPEVLLAIAADRSALFTNARRLVALNPATPDAALTLLADESYASDIRLILAAHPNFAFSDREKLRRHSIDQAANAPDPIYRTIALAQPDVDPSALLDHIHSPFWIERLAVALNPTTDIDNYAALAVDGNRLVRAAARERILPDETT